MHESLKGLIPGITEDRKKCTICSWRHFCDQEAKDKGYLTDIDGIGSKTAFILQSNGIRNIKQLASENKINLGEKLSLFNDQKYIKASKFINQAKSYISGNPIKICKNNYSNIFSLENDSGLFVFDIESNPDEKHDFLYGFLEINNVYEKVKDEFYQPLLNIQKTNKECYEKIFNKLFSKNHWPVLHYGETEKIAIMFLAKQLNISNDDMDILESRFIDLHTLIRTYWVLPLKNYSLKTVANWMGFEWQQKNVNGSKSLYWWVQYQITKNDLFLQKIIQYNKDDCLATLHIAKWLIENKEL